MQMIRIYLTVYCVDPLKAGAQKPSKLHCKDELKKKLHVKKNNFFYNIVTLSYIIEVVRPICKSYLPILPFTAYSNINI